jgi:hypothetical protein
MKWLLLSVIFVVLSCQQKPTVAVSDSGALLEDPHYKKVVNDKAVVFDTRSPFEFNTHKVPNSINLPTSDFDSDKDPMDAARRLSLYGVNPSTFIIIIGEGKGDEQKLAWEFMKLGVTNIETLKDSVFRMLNARPESSPANVSIWKPKSQYKEISTKDFKKRIEDLTPKYNSKARAATFQGFPVAEALRERVLVITPKEHWNQRSEYLFADHYYFGDPDLFDEKGFLNHGYQFDPKVSLDIKKYNTVFLVDSSPERFAHAYAIVAFGAKSLYLAPEVAEP